MVATRSEDRPLRWGVLGASRIAATRMIPAMRAVGHECVVVQSNDPTRGSQFARELEVDHWTTSVEEAVARADIDAIYVGSGNANHFHQVLAAAEAGRHVLAEKPIALNLDEAQRLVDYCAAQRVVLATNHHLPASPTHRTMRRLVAGGALGEIVAVRVGHALFLPPDYRDWRVTDPVGGGVVLDVFIHTVAALRAILSGNPMTVASEARQGTDIAETVLSSLTWSDGIVVQTIDSYENAHLPTSLEIYGREAAIRAVDCMTQDPVGHVYLVTQHEVRPVHVGEREDLYRVTLGAFGRAVHEGQAPLVTGEDGVWSLSGALAACASLAGGGVRVGVSAVSEPRA